MIVSRLLTRIHINSARSGSRARSQPLWLPFLLANKRAALPTIQTAPEVCRSVLPLTAQRASQKGLAASTKAGSEVALARLKPTRKKIAEAVKATNQIRALNSPEAVRHLANHTNDLALQGIKAAKNAKHSDLAISWDVVGWYLVQDWGANVALTVGLEAGLPFAARHLPERLAGVKTEEWLRHISDTLNATP